LEYPLSDALKTVLSSAYLPNALAIVAQLEDIPSPKAVVPFVGCLFLAIPFSAPLADPVSGAAGRGRRILVEHGKRSRTVEMRAGEHPLVNFVVSTYFITSCRIWGFSL
jgi:hypothetical protein